MKKFWRRLVKVLLAIVVLWVLLTIWAEGVGPKKIFQVGTAGARGTALIVYDPDPFYNLDQQVCEAFGKVLADSGWKVTIATVAAAKQFIDSSVKLYMFCANTYNWSPDWAVTRFIKSDALLAGKKVVAITLGGGSTGRSKKVFEKIIKTQNSNLIDSKTFWLWKPNDESRMKEGNVEVAVDMVRQWAKAIVTKI
jgi:hypothetical protein